MRTDHHLPRPRGLGIIQANAAGRPRAIGGVPAAILAAGRGQPGDDISPGAAIQAMSASLEDFKTRYGDRLAAIEAGIDDMAQRTAAHYLNGDAAGAGGRTTAARRAAIGAFGQFAKSGDAGAMAALLPQAAMTSQSDPDGGYLVPEEVAREILALQQDVSPMRRLAKIVPTKSKSYQQPVSVGGTDSGWVGEEEARPETDGPSLAMLDIPTGEIYANPAATQGMLDDSDLDLGAFVIGEISKEFDTKEGAAFITGDGIKKPRGFLTSTTYVGAGNAAFGQIQAVHGGHATLLNDADKLIDVLHSLKAAHRRNATWLMNSTTQGVVSKLKDGEGQYLWQRALALSLPDTLLGRPVELDENMPDIGANAFPVALGNWKAGYLINDRMGVRVLRDPFSNKPYVHFYATKRVGGAVLDSEAIKLLKIAA